MKAPPIPEAKDALLKLKSMGFELVFILGPGIAR